MVIKKLNYRIQPKKETPKQPEIKKAVELKKEVINIKEPISLEKEPALNKTSSNIKLVKEEISSAEKALPLIEELLKEEEFFKTEEILIETEDLL